MTTIAALHSRFAQGDDSPVALTERQIARVNDPAGEGARAFLQLDRAAVLRSADASCQRFASGDIRPLEGVTLSIKDLYDVKGEVTGAGSTVLRSRPAAIADSPAVQRLREAGAIIFGRNNMVEFAYSGIGINPHFGTPRNVWGRSGDGGGRVPGGSSSGGGVAVADGMATAALGSDTGGSVRLPAALNGVCGFKPTAVRVPVVGAIPLSVTHDSVGPIANSVACCARIDAVLAGETYESKPLRSLKGVRLLKPNAVIWRELDTEVETAINLAVEKLRAAGAEIVETNVPALDDLFSGSSVIAAEALDWHAANINVNGKGYDPRVWLRMQAGSDVTRAQYSAAIAYRRFCVDRMNLALAGFDAVVSPTVACIAPAIAPLVESDELFFKTNARILRNTAWVNFMDGCALTLPCHKKGDAPVGLQLTGSHGADHVILALGLACEAALAVAD
ncbi:MAG: amidase [Casimicrobium sp.]